MTAIVVKLVLVAVVWGGTFIAGRIAAPEMPPPTAALIRYVTASLALLAMTFAMEGGLPALDRRQWLMVTLLGFAGVAGYNYLFMVGLQTVPASRGSLIMALNPAATMIGAALFLREPITIAKIVGTLLALTGVAVELGGGNPLALVSGEIGEGELALFGCVVGWAAYTLIAKNVTGLSALAVTTYAALIGMLMLAALVVTRGDPLVPHASLRVWLALVYMGVLGTALAFVWFLEGVKTLGPARAAIFVNLVPVAAITLGLLLLGERLTVAMLVGAALVVAGVWIINRPASAMPAPAIVLHHP
ncbi:MAG TPA: DMT family transporter [Casimicrobiaceae bacterium]|jgi:drug/metabolite transporter (DMT)-like permease|nr:DMT family transporter [Casimicrobiaceae bacterium]